MGGTANDVEDHSQGGALQTAKDLFAGAAGGVAQVLIGKFELPMFDISPSMASIGVFAGATSLLRSRNRTKIMKESCKSHQNYN